MPASQPLRRSVRIPNQHTLAQQLPLLLLCFSLGCFLTLTLPRLTHAASTGSGSDRVLDQAVSDRAVSPSALDRTRGDRTVPPSPLSLALAESALRDRLPPAQAHPLPPSLQPAPPFPGSGLLSARSAPPSPNRDRAVPDLAAGPDYFDQIRPSALGYLVWSQFPVRVYREGETAVAGSGEAQRQAVWRSAVEQAVTAWQGVIPLEWTDDREGADIQILRSRPPLRYQDDGSIARARTAETRYQFRLALDRSTPAPRLSPPSPTPRIQPQFTLYLGPGQAPAQLATTARHELGHALGLWGHSLDPQDVMYGEQTAQPQTVSQRDINTLRRVYQQPTQVGWSLQG